MSQDPSLGVVDERFRVHGFENLHVCDASVFPSAITVNPQLTVMALAHLAGSKYVA
jgi:choline dehydrogenase-like flavoprotein